MPLEKGERSLPGQLRRSGIEGIGSIGFEEPVPGARVDVEGHLSSLGSQAPFGQPGVLCRFIGVIFGEMPQEGRAAYWSMARSLRP